jgi:hypothetical protein
VAAWRRCATCRRVLPAEAFEGDAESCISCLTAPPPKARTTRATPVKTVRAAMPPAEPRERQPLLGVVGSGDLEVRERRARKTALEQLAELHADDYEQLLQTARRAEGLRA